jgi:hypothetical protein
MHVAVENPPSWLMDTLATWSLRASPVKALMRATGAGELLMASSPASFAASEAVRMRMSWNPSLRCGWALNAASFAANLEVRSAMPQGRKEKEETERKRKKKRKKKITFQP